MTIEQLLIARLTECMPVRVCAEVPEDPPERYITIEKTGGGRTETINRATVAVQSRAGSMEEAICLNEAVKDAMMDYVLRDPAIGSISLNTDYNFTDPTEKKYRYQAVFDIVHY